MPDGGICIEWESNGSQSQVFTRQDLENYFDSFTVVKDTFDGEHDVKVEKLDFDELREVFFFHDYERINFLEWYFRPNQVKVIEPK